jgi:hypothetical protein
MLASVQTNSNYKRMKRLIFVSLLAISSVTVLPENPPVQVLCDCKGIGLPNPHGGSGNNSTQSATGPLVANNPKLIINLITYLEWVHVFSVI